MAFLVEEVVAAAAAVQAWCELPTPTEDAGGGEAFADALDSPLAELGAGFPERIRLPVWRRLDARGRWVETALGPALRLVKRPEARKRLFFCIHTDVVYAPGDLSAPLTPSRRGPWLHAPGSVDAKGGIWILVRALRELEETWQGESFGWTVVLNSDEEIGSPGSRTLLREASVGHACAFLFEPALPGGHLAGSRRGSGNFTAVMRGRSGHAGRDSASGRNALFAAAELATELRDWASRHAGISVNLAAMDGGGAYNRIPDLALARFNFRVQTPEDKLAVEARLREAADAWSAREGFALEWQGEFASPPKPAQGKTGLLLRYAREEAAALGLALDIQDTGGVCDGNRLAAAGIPNVDTLGAVGEGIHGAGERLWLPSLIERARLTVALTSRVLRDDAI